jgi:hypothetical protein
MADRLFLSLWFPSFDEREIMPRTLGVLNQFPFSSTLPGIGHMAVHPIFWHEPTVFEETFDYRATPEQAIELASEHVYADHAYEFEAMWDLWTPETGGGLDTQWRLAPQPVRIVAYGEEFEERESEQQGHVQLDFGLDAPFLYEDVDFDHHSEQRVKANVQKLVSLTTALEQHAGISGRILWSDSDENLAQKLITRLQRVQ